jgi:methionyl-tRNA formyltransferase
MARSTAVVFAYHNVGVRCLATLLAHNVDVKLVVTHLDNPNENIWFDSVGALAKLHGIRVVAPDDPNTAEFINEIAALKVDFLFSFYYRMMLKAAMLATANRGAYNMHGSLLPKYRGRVPINWAIIKGENQAGATLHEMVEKPDAGRLLSQQAVPILPNDTAHEVFTKVTVAAEMALHQILPSLLDGTAKPYAQDLTQGSYYGGRKPEDGVIDWQDSAQNIHNLVRAVAPPYPGATTTINGEAVMITKTLMGPAAISHTTPGRLNIGNDRAIALCGEGTMLRIIETIIDGQPHNEVMLSVRYGDGIHSMGKSS